MEPLTQEQVRVIGCLLEKEATVPDTYPMTLNGLRQACNQSSSRDPVVAYDESTVQRSLDDLKATGWVRFVHPSHGARSTKYRHVVDEKLSVGRDELAVLGVLALRGAQTSGELRTRSERWHAFDSVGEVEDVLAGLAASTDPLVAELPRGAGQHQTRWTHLLAGPVDVNSADARPATENPVDASPAEYRPAPPSQNPSVESSDEIDELRETVSALQERVDRLERELGLSGPRTATTQGPPRRSTRPWLSPSTRPVPHEPRARSRWAPW